MEAYYFDVTKAVFLDRDGVLNRTIEGDGESRSPRSLAELDVPPDVPEALRKLAQAGFLLIGISNQPEIARGQTTREMVDAIDGELMRQLPLREFFLCQHDDADACDCRKPKPGLILSAAAKYDVDLSASFMVGDRAKDIEAGRAAGCRTLLIGAGSSDADAVVGSMAEAAAWILAQDRPWTKFYDPGVPASIDYPDWTVPHLIERAAQAHPSHPALIFYGRPMSYRRLWLYVRRFAGGLQRMGVNKGDRVALFLPNTPQFVIAYYGAMLAGAVVVPFNPLYMPEEIDYQLTDCGAETMVVLSKFYPAVHGRGSLRNTIVTNIKEYFPPHLRLLFTLFREQREGHRVAIEGPGVWPWGEVLRPAEPRPVTLTSDDLAVLQYTGGTTGVPKGAMITHRAIVCNSIASRWWSNRNPEATERILAVIPFFHAYGEIVSMCATASMAGTLITLPRWDTLEVLKAIQKYRPTGFHGVPTMYVAINNHPETPKYDLRSIGGCISGSAPLPLEVAERFEALTGGRLVEGFGMTETAVASHCNPINGLRKPGSIGVPFPDVDSKIADPDDPSRELPVGDIGELLVRSPSNMKGYWNKPRETADVLTADGWLRTGDLAKRDEDGYFYIVDRKKDMIDASGFNVYPRDVEEVIFRHPAVLEAVVVGIPDAYRGETVKAYIVLKPGAAATAQDIIDFCREHLARYKVPTAVEFRDSLPKTLVGKALRRVLREEELAKGDAK